MIHRPAKVVAPPPWHLSAATRRHPPPPAATCRHILRALRCLHTQRIRDGTRVALPRSLRWPTAVSMPTSEPATPSATGWSTGWYASTSPRSSSASRSVAVAHCRATSRRSSRPSCAAGCSRARSCERPAQAAGTTAWWSVDALRCPARDGRVKIDGSLESVKAASSRSWQRSRDGVLLIMDPL